MAFIYSARAEFAKLKKPGKVLTEKAQSIQDVLEIIRVAPNGIMEVAPNMYAKSYRILDANYATKTFEEQLEFFDKWCKVINSIDVSFKITYFNQMQNMKEFREKVLYKMQGDVQDGAREAFNDIIESKMVEGTNGIEKLKIFTITVERFNYEEAKNYINIIEANLQKNFASLTASLQPLSANEKMEILYNFFHMGEEEKFQFDINSYIRNGKDWRNDIVCPDMDFKYNDHFRMDNYIGKAMCVSPDGYPSTMKDEFIAALTAINQPGIFSFDFVPVSKKLLKDVLDVKHMGVESDIARQQQKHNDNNNFSSEVSYKVRRQKKEIEEMMDDVEENDQKGFWTGISYVLLGKNQRELNDAINNVDMILSEHGLKGEIYQMRQREGLNTALPIGVRQVDRMRALFTRAAASFIPFYVQNIQMEGGFYYGVCSLSKWIILGNRKKLRNASGWILGTPGAGKSFTGAKFEIGQVLSSLKKGEREDIIIIDPTHEYYDVADSFGGKVLELSTDADTFFNPLDCKLEDYEDEKTYKQLIAEKSKLFHGICSKIMGHEFSSGHATIINRSMHILFDSIRALPKEKRYVPIMTDFHAVIKEQKEELAELLALNLERFVDGSFDIFNHHSNIDIDSQVIVYGIRDLDEDLLNIAMTIMLENITNKILSNMAKGITTWLYIDEFHHFLKDPYIRDYFITLWAKIRKIGGIPTALTQNISMVLADHRIASMISNSEYFMFLKQSGKDIKAILENFDDISQEMVQYFTNVDSGCGVIKFGDTVVPFNNRIDKTSPIYDIFNTNFHEKVAMHKSKEQMKDVS